MKRLVLLTALLLAFGASMAHAQATRRVLVEEFTNTGCPPCAATDPMVESFEFERLDKVAMIKWHTSWPDNTDPFYNAQVPTSLSDTRGVNLYGVTGVPFISMDGTPINNVGNFSVSDKQSFLNYVDQRIGTSTPYDIAITQSMTTDSIFADITIKCLGDPLGTSLLLGVVFAERFNPFHGNNGRPFYTSIVRSVPSGLASTGAIKTSTGFPTLSMVKGDTKSFHYGAKINTKWTLNQMMSVVFIQDPTTKEVYNANWTVPGLKIEDPNTILTIPADAQLDYKLTNSSPSPVVLKATFSGTGIPANWNVATVGIAADSSVTVPANGNTTVSVNSTAATNQNGYKPFSITFTTPSNFYIGAVAGIGWGKNNLHVIVDAGAGTAKGNTLATAIAAASSDYVNKTVVIPRADFESDFTDWSRFLTVLYLAGTQVGLYSDVGSWEKLAPYLAGGGHFLLSSSVAINAYFSASNDALSQLWRDNFHIEPSAYDNTTSWSSLVGITDDPIGNGITTTASGNATTQPLTPTDADGIPSFQDENGNNVAMHYMNSTSGKSVMLTFELENVKTADRNTVVKRVMDWFAGVASVKTSNNAFDVKITNYPNPVTKATKFDYSLTERGIVNLALYDVMGREVSSIVSNETEDAGTYSADYDASNLANGSYTYVLTTGSKKVVGTMTVTK
jgi:hypothetical protein